MSVNTIFVTGNAGTGKSHSLKMQHELNPGSIMICSTTGISAINMGCITINSALKYFDTDSLRDSFVAGHLVRNIEKILAGSEKTIGIDEISMMPSEQLDILYDAFEIASRSSKVQGDVNLMLTGDFAQLPPVKGNFAFESGCWDKFKDNTIKLTESYRQTNPLFLNALDMFRAGNGKDGVDLLKQCGVRFSPNVIKFNGTTIVPVNDMVDRYNRIQFDELKTPSIYVKTERQGLQLSEWKDPKIPDVLEMKIGALVMILSNDPMFRSYANGDTGIIEDYDTANRVFKIKLLRNQVSVNIGYITRLHREYPKGVVQGEKPVVGSVMYVPIRLAYATTVHKSQGLTLDNVQLDFRHRFFANPSSMYVALSRCRTPEGLRLVGDEKLMIKRTVMHPKVKEFI